MIINITSDSPSKTKSIGRLFSRVFSPGDVVLLDGDLGAGKTTFINGIALGLGIKDDLASPSFTILNIYNLSGRSNMVHADFYRLKGIDEIIGIGIEDYIYEKNNYICIEWGKKIKNYLENDYIEIEFRYHTGYSPMYRYHDNLLIRHIVFNAQNKYWIKRLKTFRKLLIYNSL